MSMPPRSCGTTNAGRAWLQLSLGRSAGPCGSFARHLTAGRGTALGIVGYWSGVFPTR